MGCFNVRCTYSNSEIHSDDEVMIYLIKSNSFGDGMKGFSCYPWDAYSLLGPGIPAKYDEYGWYNVDEEDPVVKEYLKLVSKEIHVRKNGPTDYRSGAARDYIRELQAWEDACEEDSSLITDRPIMTWEALGEFIHDGSLEVKQRFAGSSEQFALPYVHVMAVHRGHQQEFMTGSMDIGWGRKKDDLVSELMSIWKRINRPAVTRDQVAHLLAQNKLTDEEEALVAQYYDMLLGGNANTKLSTEFLDPGAITMSDMAEFLDLQNFVERALAMYTLQMRFNETGVRFLPHGPGHQCHNFDIEIQKAKAVLAELQERALAKGYDEDGNYNEDEW